MILKYDNLNYVTYDKGLFKWINFYYTHSDFVFFFHF